MWRRVTRFHGLKRIADPPAQMARLLRKPMNDKTASLELTPRRGDADARGGLERRAVFFFLQGGPLPAGSRCWRRVRNGSISRKNSSTVREIVREDARDAELGLREHWVIPPNRSHHGAGGWAHGS